MQEGSQAGDEVSSAELRICFTPGLERLAQDLAAGLQAGAPTAFAPANMLGLTAAGKVIVLWRGLDRVLDDCLSNGQSAASAISAWMEEADRLLSTFRQHRRQVILVKAETFQHGGAGILAERLGHAEFPVPAPAAPAPIARAMAEVSEAEPAEQDESAASAA